MHPLAVEVLGERGDVGLCPADPQLARLLAAARAGEGELLRLSPRRVVLKLALADGVWLLKVDRPRRALEGLRNVLRAPSGLREARNYRRLTERLPGPRLPEPVHAEAFADGASLYARPWMAGTPLSEVLPEQAELLREGLDALHRAGWSDPDLLAQDLLVVDGALLPLDLGAARVSARPVGRRRRRRDLLLVLASLPESTVEHSLAALRAPDGAELLHGSAALRRQRLHRQSRRCLRRTRDFHPHPDGGIERVEGLPEDVAVGGIARYATRRAAARAFRALYERELLGEPAPRVLRLLRAGGGWEVHADAPLRREATAGGE